jgi:hypothetical protein
MKIDDFLTCDSLAKLAFMVIVTCLMILVPVARDVYHAMKANYKRTFIWFGSIICANQVVTILVLLRYGSGCH